jgi:hypothetical protein
MAPVVIVHKKQERDGKEIFSFVAKEVSLLFVPYYLESKEAHGPRNRL